MPKTKTIIKDNENEFDEGFIPAGDEESTILSNGETYSSIDEVEDPDDEVEDRAEMESFSQENYSMTETEQIDDGSSIEANEDTLEQVPGYDYSFADVESIEELVGEDDDEYLADAYYGSYGDSDSALFSTRKALKSTGMESISEVVIGKDDRKKINATTSYPWRLICSLKITAADGKRFIGTGWLVGHRTVITAGHCVYMHNHGGWVRSIEVIPGRNGSSRPFGSSMTYSFRSVKGWTKNKKRGYDYGAIILPKSKPFGKQLGYFGFANYSIFNLLGWKVNLAGYPGDKPAGTMWWHCRAIKLVTSRRLFYNIDTYGGQSGSPVWIKNGSKRRVVGIHTSGSSSGNGATRICKGVFNRIKAWKKEGQL